jgi:cytochrome c biogenesis protein CcmG, thiol:disulfide interchange protein DsbE
MGGRSFIVVLAVLAIVALLGFGLVANSGVELAVGEPAPDAPLERLDGGGEVRLADYRGEWVLVNFWASWCEPCRRESPAIERYARRHRDELTVVGINTEDLSEDALAFVDEYELSWEMLRDSRGERKDDYGIFALPETFLVDPEGRLALIRRGVVDREYLDEYVTPLITGEAPTA